VQSIAWLHELCDIASQSQPGISHTVQEAQECEQEQKKLEATAEVGTVVNHDRFEVNSAWPSSVAILA